ncbi:MULTISPECIES: endonuclease domain-containing protein [unclassified Nocardia]|uniref:endonuclease domain-containing protein n=1 Tax=unclassified Nocardia TaxID=2637762 RepID=UPI001CE47CE9|nr:MULTISPECIES: DUF559 domain-containing protein [unclassified Nocardia]
MPTVGAAQTLLDCVSVLRSDKADQLIDEHAGRSIDLNDLFELSRTGRHGAPALRKQLREAALNAASDPEGLFARALARRNLHLLSNHPVGPYFGDFVDERSRTIIEIDGREFHSESSAFRHDRRRQNWLLLHGWPVLRYAAADVYTAIDTCADEVVAVIRQRRQTS